jgi:hypothetical protein
MEHGVLVVVLKVDPTVRPYFFEKTQANCHSCKKGGIAGFVFRESWVGDQQNVLGLIASSK